MAYGKIKADTFVYDNSGSDVEVTLASLGSKVDANNPTFTGTVTIPTPAANDNTTKAASTAYVQTELGDYAALAGATFTGNVVMSANLTVQGTTTTISSTTIEVADKNLELGKVDTPTDTTADGGGITLKGATDKTFNWVNASDAWESSEHIRLGDSKQLQFGADCDLYQWHDGSNGYLRNTNGSLYIEAKGGENALVAIPDGAVQLYHNHVKKIETTAAGVTVSGSVTDSKGDVRQIVISAKSSAYTLVADDAGKAIYTSSGGVTVPNAVFTAGDAVTIINNSGSDQTITQGTNVTLYNSADASTGNRTLAARGMATLWWAGSSTAYISGAGLS